MKIKSIVALLICSLLVPMISMNSRAITGQWDSKFPMGNGIGVSYYSKKSSYLWVGDSRVVQLYSYSGKDSVVACWGGHYTSLCDGAGMRIDNKSRTSAIKRIVKKIVKKFGVANVVLVPTINDYTSPKSVKWTLSNYMKTYKRIKKMSKHVHIITPSLIKKHNGTSCSSFNSEIKKKVMHYVKVEFKAIGYNLRLGDRVHFSDEGLEILRQAVYNATDGDPKERLVVTPTGYAYMR